MRKMQMEKGNGNHYTKELFIGGDVNVVDVQDVGMDSNVVLEIGSGNAKVLSVYSDNNGLREFLLLEYAGGKETLREEATILDTQEYADSWGEEHIENFYKIIENYKDGMVEV